jgi:hypothetical protein
MKKTKRGAGKKVASVVKRKMTGIVKKLIRKRKASK